MNHDEILIPRGYGWLVRHAIAEAVRMAERMAADQKGKRTPFTCDATEGQITITVAEAR